MTVLRRNCDSCKLHVSTLLVCWALCALLVGELQLLKLVPPAGIQIILAGLTAALLAGAIFSCPIRSFVQTQPTRLLIGFHAIRFVGIYFLVLHQRGELPFAFAVYGGIGDILIASGAVALASRKRPERYRRVLFTWNLLGLADILFVVATAARLTIAEPISMSALTTLPLSFLPTLVVPLIIASHIWIFARLRKAAKLNTQILAASSMASPETVYAK